MRTPIPITDRLTTTSLSNVVAADLGIDPTEGYRLVTAVFGAIARAAVSGHDVAVTNFGTWISYPSAPVRRRNPQNGEPVIIPERRKLRFRVSPALMHAVRTQDPAFTIRKARSGRSAHRDTAAE